MTLLANGIDPDGWPLEDVIDACDVLEATRRTVPRSKWVEEIALAADAASFDGLI